MPRAGLTEEEKEERVLLFKRYVRVCVCVCVCVGDMFVELYVLLLFL